MKIALILVISFFSLKSICQEKIGNSFLKTEYSYQYALIEASRQKMIGNINEAVNLYLSCISSNPECDAAYYELGTVYSVLGENLKSEENLEKAYQLNKSNYWYGIAYSELLKVNGKSSESLKILKKTRKLNKLNSLTIDFKVAEIYNESGKYSKALKLLEKIEKENGVSELISFKKIEIYKLQNKNDQAESVLRGLIMRAPEIPEYQIFLAEFFTETGDSAKALIAYENAYKLDSSNIFAITNLADLYSSQGDDDKAYFFLNRAFINPDIPLNSKIQTMMYLNKDRGLIKNNSENIERMIVTLLSQYPDNYDVTMVAYDFYNGLENHIKALELIKKLLVTKKDDYIIWQQALYNASMLEDYNELILIGEEACKYFPNKSELYLFVGMAYSQKKDYEKAYSVLSESFNKIRDSDKIKVQFLLFLSESAYYTGRKKEAFSYYDRLILEDPSNDFAKNNYSYYLALDSTDLLKAKELSYSTIVNSPENSTFLDTYAWILYKIGDFENAKYYAEKAMVINAESDPDIIFHYAEILKSLGELELASKYFKHAQDRGYKDDDVEE